MDLKYTIQNLRQHLKEDIKKIVGEFKSDEQMLEILKKRLTKKEFKYYRLKSENISKEELMESLKCDNQRLEDIEKQTILKLNQEKLKNELTG
jgi:hypothetical protein